MRADSYGLFWEDRPTVKQNQKAARVIPPVPGTGWAAPSEFPRLEAAEKLVIDVETYDPNLLTNGPGWATRDGHIVGLAVGTDDRQWYFPMRHEYGGGNMDADMVLRWARDELCRDTQPKIGANLLYDIGWLRCEGINVQGDLIDVQFAEPLLDEYAVTYALGALGEQYLGESKNEDMLYDWLQSAYGGPAGRKQAGNIYRAPASIVGPYAESDVDLPLRIYEKQEASLQRQGLINLFKMECSLIPLLIEMRMRGVRVDIDKAERTRLMFIEREVCIQKQLERITGRRGFNPDIKDDMVAAFDKLGLSYGRTKPSKSFPDGQPSFTKPFLESIDHDLPKQILELKRLVKARGTFIEGYILDKAHQGRVHCQFHPLRADENGTVSGRFSSSTPNLQNIPARDKEMKELIRGCFLPEPGQQWFAPDYSQIEYRLMVNAARGKGASEARRLFNENPRMDYHAFTGELVNEILGIRLDRTPVKNVNFGTIFGMGRDTLLAMLHTMSESQANEFFNAYDEAIPYAKSTSEAATNVARSKGFIRTVLNRRARFPFWEAANWDDRDGVMRDKGLAIKEWGHVVRAYTHKALNAYTQGSAADIIKKAMLDIWEAGLAVPLVQVHDELGFSLNPGPEADEIVQLMQDAVKIKVPLLVDAEWGPSWGEVK